MILESFWQALQASAVGDFIATSTWAFPTLETLHVIALVTVLGTIVIVDIRLLGLTSTDYPVTVISNDTLKITWIAFICAAITGSLLFTAKAHDYMINPYFIRKMVLLALAGVNMGVFHVLTWKSVKQWDTGGMIPVAAKVAGVLSLILWVGVVMMGRTIGFTLGIFY